MNENFLLDRLTVENNMSKDFKNIKSLDLTIKTPGSRKIKDQCEKL